VIELATPGACAWYALGSSPARMVCVLLGLVGLAVVVYVVVPVLKAIGVCWSAMIEARLPAFRSGAWPSSPPSVVTCLRTCVRYPTAVRTWEANDPDFGRPIAAPLDRCAELLGVDLATIREVAANVEPYFRVDGTKVWSLMQLERQLRPEAFRRRRAATSIVGAPMPLTRECRPDVR
jgi:hypothetical protein